MPQETAMAKLVAALGQYFQPRGITRRMTVTNAKPAGKAQIIIGTIGEGRTAVPGQTFDIGNGDAYANGEVYELHGTGDPNDPQWRIGRRLVARNPKRGADLYAALPAPVWSTITNPDDTFANPICLGTEPDLNATTGANGEPLALIHAIYRTIVPGSYSVYKDHITDVQLQVKAATADGWRNIPKQQVTPSRPIRITLNADITNTTTAVAITLPADVTLDELMPGYYVHWRIDGEIVIGKIVSTVLLTILAASGRGAESTVAVSHTTGAQIDLLSGVAVAHGMDPGVETQARLAFVDGYGVAGPPSTVNVLTTWKRVSIPPVTSLSVDMRSNGFKLAWTRPTDPDTSLPVTARLFYKVYRNTSASTSGAKVVRERDMNLEDDIAASDWDTDATRAAAFWFGVLAFDGFGNESTIVWEKDNVPPPAPTGVTFTSVPNGILVSVDPNTDTAHLDPGFKEYVLYTNAAGSGTTGTEVSRGATLAFVWEVYSLDSQTYYQLASADYAGNVSALGTGNWKFVASLYPTNDWPQNGNFQDPDPETPAPGVTGAYPRWWTVDYNGMPGGRAYATYLAAGGAEGNRVIAVPVIANLPLSIGFYPVQSTIQIIPSQKTPTFEAWVMATQTLNDGGGAGGSDDHRISLSARLSSYAADDGGGSVGDYAVIGADTTLTANTWTKISIVMLPLSTTYPTGRTSSLSVYVSTSSIATFPQTNAAYTLYIDSVRIIWV